MTATALYRALVKAGAGEDVAMEAAQEIDQQVVTKSFLKAELNAQEARLSDKLTWRVILIVGIFSGIVVAAVGFMLQGLPGASG